MSPWAIAPAFDKTADKVGQNSSGFYCPKMAEAVAMWLSPPLASLGPGEVLRAGGNLEVVLDDAQVDLGEECRCGLSLHFVARKREGELLLVHGRGGRAGRPRRRGGTTRGSSRSRSRPRRRP